MSVTVPFLTTKHFDFTGLNNILAYDTTLLEAMRIMFKPRWTVCKDDACLWQYL